MPGSLQRSYGLRTITNLWAGGAGPTLFETEMHREENVAEVNALTAGGPEVEVSDVLARYIVGATFEALPHAVAIKAGQHILDTIAAIISGSALEPGRFAKAYISSLGGEPVCSVLGTNIRTNPINAALANGMFAHADETDDSHAPSLNHPGCSIVPAALAAAEIGGKSGRDLITAVVLGYDIGTRISMSLGGSRFADRYHHSSHAFGGIFGSTAAACHLLGLDNAATGWALSHTVQMASGNRCWIRDPDHVQKAFIFGGMPAQGGVQAALMAATGITGAPRALEGVPGLYVAFPEEAQPRLAVEELGQRYEVMRTSIKRWCVGSPCQAALDGIEELTRTHGIGLGDIASLRITLPAQRAQVVDSAMPNINVAHLVALYLVDGGASFATVHDESRMHDPRILEARQKISVAPRPGAARGEQAQLILELKDGRTLVREPQPVRGQPANPMTQKEVSAKAFELVSPVLGEHKAVTLIDALERLPTVGNIKDLVAVWSTADPLG